MRRLAIFGGTFDPVHNGHIDTSANIQASFHFDTLYFLPCKMPTLKPAATASTMQRIAMLELAIKDKANYQLDLREINRSSPSYMVDTLQSIRLEQPDASISLIMGYDAFLSLPQWYQWQKLLTLANLLVINREQCVKTAVPEEIVQLLNNHKEDNRADLLNNKSGKIVLFDAGAYDISSTAIREKIKEKGNIDQLLPNKVLEYIKQWALYQ